MDSPTLTLHFSIQLRRVIQILKTLVCFKYSKKAFFKCEVLIVRLYRFENEEGKPDTANQANYRNFVIRLCASIRQRGITFSNFVLSTRWSNPSFS